VERVGLARAPVSDLYHFLLTTSWRWLVAVIVGVYVAGNCLFALGYLAIGDGIENAHPGSFKDAFFFSVQTMATIGYGKMVPQTVMANVLVTVEALIGMLTVAMASGLMFAKLSRPTGRVLFSKVALITTYDGQPSFMFRAANERANQILEAQIRVTLARSEKTAEGIAMRRLYDLPLVRSQTAVFTLSWSAIHAIGESSPLRGATLDSLTAQNAEIIVSLTGIDDTFSQTVHARYSYFPDTLVWDAHFADILTLLPDGHRRVDYTHFHDVVKAKGAAKDKPS
jgi:inward rectifier potassium channel